MGLFGGAGDVFGGTGIVELFTTGTVTGLLAGGGTDELLAGGAGVVAGGGTTLLTGQTVV